MHEAATRLHACRSVNGWNSATAPAYWVVHRSDLHAALLRCASDREEISVRTNFRVADVTARNDATVVRTEAGDEVVGRFAVGADGLWSRLREQVCPNFGLVYAGSTAARAVVDIEKVPDALREPVTHVWLATNAHIVSYPVAGGTKVAIVAITAAPQPAAGWGVPVEADSFLARLMPINTDLADFLASAADWHSWALFDPGPLPRWHDKGTILIGDAAHPILPYLAQGGAMGHRGRLCPWPTGPPA